MKTQPFVVLLSFALCTASCKKEFLSSPPSSSPHENATAVPAASFQNADALSGRIINPLDFVTGIDNPYFPLMPGTIFKYINTIVEDRHATVEHITVTVTNDIKVILGVGCEVVHDQVMTNGKLTEDTYDWYAQDKKGNIWYFGEDTKSYHNGQVDSSGSFQAGVDKAFAGIIMWAEPSAHIGQVYPQEYYKGEAEDRATVINTHGTATVVYGTFQNCVVTKEFTPLEPGVIEYKYYAPGVGQVLTVLNKGGQEREELISIAHF